MYIWGWGLKYVYICIHIYIYLYSEFNSIPRIHDFLPSSFPPPPLSPPSPRQLSGRVNSWGGGEEEEEEERRKGGSQGKNEVKEEKKSRKEVKAQSQGRKEFKKWKNARNPCSVLTIKPIYIIRVKKINLFVYRIMTEYDFKISKDQKINPD